MAKRRSKARGKASKSRRKTKKPMTNAKPATRRKPKMAKPGKKAAATRPHAAKSAAKRVRATIAMHEGGDRDPGQGRATSPALRGKPARQIRSASRLPAMPFNYSHDSVMNVLVGMLILFAVVSAGIFYPQTTTTEQALTAAAPGMMQKK